MAENGFLVLEESRNAIGKSDVRTVWCISYTESCNISHGLFFESGIRLLVMDLSHLQ